MKYQPITLKNLKVICLDIQATSSRPDSGEVLEIGWMECSAEEDLNNETFSSSRFLSNPEKSAPKND